jgi:hypothetical protein
MESVNFVTGLALMVARLQAVGGGRWAVGGRNCAQMTIGVDGIAIDPEFIALA